MSKTIVDLGFINITWYAFLIVTGMVLGVLIAIRESKEHKIDKNLFLDYLFYVLIFGVIGARIWYVIFDWNIYAANPLSVFAIWNGGLAIHGGLVGGLIYTIYFCKRYSINMYMLGDIAAPSLLLAQSVGRWGNFVNQEAHGGATTQEFLQNTLHLPEFIVNQMYINGVYHQPTFLYESIWNFIGFIIALVMRKKYRFKYGTIFAFYLVWYGSIRTVIEQMRTDALLLGNIKVAQLTSILMFLIGVIILINKYVKGKYEK